MSDDGNRLLLAVSKSVVGVEDQARVPPGMAFDGNALRSIRSCCACIYRGYLLTQVAGGVWADKYGGKRILGFGVIWWSLATMATPIAASMGLPVLLAARACMGIGEGVAMPAMNNLLSRCVPSGCLPSWALPPGFGAASACASLVDVGN